MPNVEVEGQVFNFPEGTSDEVIGNAIRQHFAGGQPMAQPERGILDFPALPEGKLSEAVSEPGDAEKMTRDVRGTAEAALAIGSGVVAEPIAGLAGLATLPFAGVDKATENIEKIREFFTITPRSPEGLEKLKGFAELLEPVAEKIKQAEKATGGAAFEAARPGEPVKPGGVRETVGGVAGAVGEALPAAALTALGVGAVRRVVGAGKTVIEGTLKEALKKGDVLTSDVFPPKTFVGKSFQKITERIPLLGTGRVRAAQQRTRVESLDDISKEFDIEPGATFEKDIVSSAEKVFRSSQKKAARLRNEAITELNKVGEVSPAAAIKEIDSQISRIQKLGERGDAELLSTLKNIKGELAGNFERLKDIRTTIFDDISDIGSLKSSIKSGGDAVLTRVAGALSKDLDDFSINASKGAGKNKNLSLASSKWKASNRIFKDNFAKARETELKRALTKGKVVPEVVNSTIKGGKNSQLQLMHRNLDLDGRKAVQKQILSNALERANGNPTAFLNDLNRINNRKAVRVFFRGKDRKHLEGYKKFLDITRRAQDEAASIASQQEVTSVGLLGSAFIAPKPVIGAAAAVGVLGRAFESQVVRSLLLRLSNLPPTSKKAKDIANKLAPLIAQTGKNNG